MTHPFYAVLLFLLLIVVLGALRAEAKVIDGGPQPLSDMSSIGESLRNAGQRPLHILYVHGMEALGSGDSHAFQKGICELMKGCTLSGDPIPVNREYADRGEFQLGAEPPSIEYMRKAVWLSKDEWSASAPFVDHYVLKRSDGGPVVVDEINWWPLVFPLKCRNTIPGEAHLAGPDAKLLDLCSTKTEEDQPNHPGRFKSYQWLNPDDAAKLKAMPRKGAWANRSLKNNIMDWGVSDAFIAVGSMRDILREGMRQLFVKSARFSAESSAAHDWAQQLANPQGIDREFIVVSHSLGSYLVFSTLNLDDESVTRQNVPGESSGDAARRTEEDDAARYILERTSLVYFFANQVPLLELATMEVPANAQAAPAAAMVQPKPADSLSRRMVRWKDLRKKFKQTGSIAEAAPVPPPQVIAWSDPSDVLSWYVPGIDDLKVDNLYVRNTWWHWLIANPASAHGNYASNKSVLRIMMRKRSALPPSP